MQEMKMNDTIKGWKVEVESKAAKAAAEAEGKPYAPMTELFAEYGEGEFSAPELGSHEVVLTTAEGVRISIRLEGMECRLGLRRGILCELAKQVNAAKGWVESDVCDVSAKYDGDLKVRLTALGEKPKIDPEATRKASPALTEYDLTKIMIDGKPIICEGTVLKDRRSVYKPDFAKKLAEMVTAHVKEATGVEAKVGVGEITTEGADYNYAAYTLECDSKEDAHKVLKEVFGIRNAEDLAPRWTADPDADGKCAVRYAFCMYDEVCC